MSAVVGTTERRVAGLDGLRGVACLMVFLYHLRWHAQPSMESPLRLELGGWNIERFLASFDAGVAIFFVLSGFLLSLPFWRSILAKTPPPDFRNYLWRRVCRIIPAYYAVLIVVYLLRPGTYTLSGASDFLLHATFLHTFADESYYGVYPLLWTIGIELQFYIALPAMMFGLAWLYRRGGTVIALTTLFASTFFLDVAARTILAQLAPAIPDRFLADQESAVVGGTLFSYLKVFAFGIAGSFVFLKWHPRPAIADVFAGVSLTAFFALLLFGHEAGWRETSLTGWPLNALAIAVLVVSVARSRISARILSSRPAIAIGTISYGVYLWHELIQRSVFGGTLPNRLSGVALFIVGGLISLLITLLVAGLSWRFVEKPVLHSARASRA